MAYTRTNWVDRNVQYPKRYQLTLVSGTTYDLTPVTGTVTAVGTPVNATNMNNIENGLQDLSLVIALGGLVYI